MRTVFIISLFLIVSNNYSQTKIEVEKNFVKIKNILSSENSLKELRIKLDSIKMTFKDQKNNFVDDFLNRSIDFEFNHNRIRIQFDLWQYQIDLISKNDTILLKSLKTEHFKKYAYKFINKQGLEQYLVKRNEYYKSTKNYKDLLSEISSDETFAMYCGESLSYTKEGYEIRKIVDKNDVLSLKKMISSFSCEKQSYALLGFNMLTDKKIDFPLEYQKMVEHIKARNSELQICSGCITGLVEKIY